MKASEGERKLHIEGLGCEGPTSFIQQLFPNEEETIWLKSKNPELFPQMC